MHAVEAAKQGGLATARWPDQRCHFSISDRQVYIFQCMIAAIEKIEVLGFSLEWANHRVNMIRHIEFLPFDVFTDSVAQPDGEGVHDQCGNDNYDASGGSVELKLDLRT